MKYLYLAGKLVEESLPPGPWRRHVADDDAVEDEHEQHQRQHHEEEDLRWER